MLVRAPLPEGQEFSLNFLMTFFTLVVVTLVLTTFFQPVQASSSLWAHLPIPRAPLYLSFGPLYLALFSRDPSYTPMYNAFHYQWGPFTL